MKLVLSTLISNDLFIFFLSTLEALLFHAMMCSMNDFGQAVHEILENNYLKDNFENLETRDLVLTF